MALASPPVRLPPAWTKVEPNVLYAQWKKTTIDEEVTVIITGKTDTKVYNGSEQSVTGYEVKSISNELHKTADFTFNGTATATGTDADTYQMGLKKPENFENKNANFSKVTFVVTDGSLTITKRDATLTSASASKPYDGTALTSKNVTVGGNGFADGEGAENLPDVSGPALKPKLANRIMNSLMS